MSPAATDLLDEPARTDPVIHGLSEVIGGPIGDHAVRPPRAGRFWTVARIILALVCLTLALHWVQRSPCRDGAWEDLEQYKHFCYTDVLALYYNEGLGSGEVPYADHAVEYPVLTGALLGVLGLPVHAYGVSHPGANQGQIFYDLNAFVLASLGVATAAALLALRRRRPWDAAMFALAPALFISATVNWDLLAVSLATFGLLAWARRRPGLAGVLIGLGIAAKLFPLLLLFPLLILALRTGRWRCALGTVGAAAVTWLAVNVPVAVLWTGNWGKFFSFNSERGVDWGTIWYIGGHFPLGGDRYGLPWFGSLDREPGHGTLNALYLGFFLAACIGIAVLALRVRQRPRVAQLAFLVLAAFVIFGKVWSQQYVLWLVPLAVLARPRWGAFLAWQVAEVAYFAAFYGELMGASGRQVFPEGVFVLASLVRLATLCVLVGFVVRDILRPERDPVRAAAYADDPDGGAFDGAPDSWLFARPAADPMLTAADPSHTEGPAYTPAGPSQTVQMKAAFLRRDRRR